MFTNTSILDREAKILHCVESFSKTVEIEECAQILEELFFEWVGSESCDSTSAEYRAKAAYCYKSLQKFLTKIDTNLKQEVSHD